MLSKKGRYFNGKKRCEGGGGEAWRSHFTEKTLCKYVPNTCTFPGLFPIYDIMPNLFTKFITRLIRFTTTSQHLS